MTPLVRRLVRTAAYTALSLSAPAACAAPSKTMASPQEPLSSFDFKGVTLGPSRFREQVEEVKAYYLAIPDDDLLLGFRKRAGRPAPGKEMGGWYSSDVFHTFGQYISGLARLYAATGDEECRDKAARLIHEWGLCIEKDGFFYYSRSPNSPHYVYDKMVGGLADAIAYCGTSEAREHLARVTGWAEKNLSREHRPTEECDPSEWYTLSENLFRAFLVTGEKRYRDFAEAWEYDAYWGHLLRGEDVFHTPPCAGRYHAYSHVNTLSGAAAAYRVTGDTGYLTTLRKAWTFLRTTQEMATGGYGPDERIAPPDELRRRLDTTATSFETPCGSWAVFKLAKYLLSFTGEARYGDWAERLVYNGVGAVIPMSRDGSVMYNTNVNPAGGAKRNVSPWSCCTGTLPQAVADYADLIWFHGQDGIYLNLFIPSTVKWRVGGTEAVITQETSFPEGGATRLVVHTGAPAKFALCIRKPEWLDGPPDLRVNGETVKAAVSRGWLRLKRTWKDGDVVTLALPTHFSRAPYPGAAASSFPAAVNQGPVTLAFISPQGNPAGWLDWSNLGKSLVPAGAPLRYTLADQPSVSVRPFYTLREAERYFIYLNPDDPRTAFGHGDLTYSGEWSDFGVIHASKSKGASVSRSFRGTGVIWRGYRYDDAGIAEVVIDGQSAARVDQHDAARDVLFEWKSGRLSPGEHTIELRVTGERNAASKDAWVNISSLESLE